MSVGEVLESADGSILKISGVTPLTLTQVMESLAQTDGIQSDHQLSVVKNKNPDYRWLDGFHRSILDRYGFDLDNLEMIDVHYAKNLPFMFVEPGRKLTIYRDNSANIGRMYLNGKLVYELLANQQI